VAAYDVVIRNGLVVDGTGAPARRADIAVSGDRLAAVGDVADGGEA
jgi:N-acyl-D-amino-acid deacylase